jgi:DNA-binding NarL/FixJ family response regulator
VKERWLAENGDILMTRILIADDHAIVREGLKQVIAKAPDMTVTAEATDGHEAVGKATAEDCDVVLLDISMPGRNGLEALRLIKSQNPRLAILMLSVHSEETYAVRALKAGASGYLTKDSAPERLIEAIRKVSLGGKYVSPSLAERLAQEIGPSSQISPHERLSDREFQVLRLLASGRTVREIAAELSLGVPSVSTYRARIIGKMKLKNVAELTHYAIRNRLAD